MNTIHTDDLNEEVLFFPWYQSSIPLTMDSAAFRSASFSSESILI